MATKAKGTTFTARGIAYASVTVAPKKRLARNLQGIVEAGDTAGALAWAHALQDIVDALRAAARTSEIEAKIDAALQVGRDDRESGLERVRDAAAKLRAMKSAATLVTTGAPTTWTVKTFGSRWTNGELHRDYPDHVLPKKSARNDAGLLQTHVYPVVGPVRLSDFSLAHAQDVMRRLPVLSSSRRRAVAGIMVRLMNLAVYPCEILKASPIPRGFLPRVRVRVGAYLYPSDDRALLACRQVPLQYRLLYGFLAREGMRRIEALTLGWDDLDLDHGVVRLDRNKTDDPRAWALDPGTTAALAWWKQKQKKKGGAVFGIGVSGHLAADLRAHLELANVYRPELFEQNEQRRQINVHGLRATFVTLSLANGRSETWVQDRTGHRSSIMVNRYRRAARTAAELGLGALSPLDHALPEISAQRPQ